MKKLFFLISLFIFANLLGMKENLQERPLPDLIIILNDYLGTSPKTAIHLSEKNFKAALDIAIACMNHSKATTPTIEKSLNLIRKLIIENYTEAEKKGLDFAQKWVTNKQDSIKSMSLDIFLALVKKGNVEAYQKSLDAAGAILIPPSKHFWSKENPEPDEFTKAKAIRIVASLIEKDYKAAYPKALDIAKKHINDDKTFVKTGILALFKSLVAKKYELAYQAAIDAAKINILIECTRIEKPNVLYDEYSMQNDALEIFELLIKMNTKDAYNKAIEALKTDLTTIKNLRSQKTVLHLFACCINSEINPSKELCDNAFNAAKNWATDPDLFLKGEVFKLFNALVNKSYETAYKYIITAAKSNVFQMPFFGPNYALQILKTLIERKNQAAINATSELIEANKNNTNRTLLSELKKLIQPKKEEPITPKPETPQPPATKSEPPATKPEDYDDTLTSIGNLFKEEETKKIQNPLLLNLNTLQSDINNIQKSMQNVSGKLDKLKTALN